MPPKKSGPTAEKTPSGKQAGRKREHEAGGSGESPEKKKGAKKDDAINSHIFLVGYTEPERKKVEDLCKGHGFAVDQSFSSSMTHLVIKSMGSLKCSQQLLPIYYAVMKGIWILKPSFLPPTTKKRNSLGAPPHLQNEQAHVYDGKEVDALTRASSEFPTMMEVLGTRAYVQGLAKKGEPPILGAEPFQKVAILAGRAQAMKQRKEELKLLMEAAGATVLDDNVFKTWKAKRKRAGDEVERPSMVVIVNGEKNYPACGLDDETIRDLLKARAPLFYEECIVKIFQQRLVELSTNMDSLMMASFVFIHDAMPTVDPDAKLQELVLLGGSGGGADTASKATPSVVDRTPSGRRLNSRAVSVMRASSSNEQVNKEKRKGVRKEKEKKEEVKEEKKNEEEEVKNEEETPPKATEEEEKEVKMDDRKEEEEKEVKKEKKEKKTKKKGKKEEKMEVDEEEKEMPAKAAEEEEKEEEAPMPAIQPKRSRGRPRKDSVKKDEEKMGDGKGEEDEKKKEGEKEKMEDETPKAPKKEVRRGGPRMEEIEEEVKEEDKKEKEEDNEKRKKERNEEKEDEEAAIDQMLIDDIDPALGDGSVDLFDEIEKEERGGRGEKKNRKKEERKEGKQEEKEEEEAAIDQMLIDDIDPALTDTNLDLFAEIEREIKEREGRGGVVRSEAELRELQELMADRGDEEEEGERDPPVTPEPLFVFSPMSSQPPIVIPSQLMRDLAVGEGEEERKEEEENEEVKEKEEENGEEDEMNRQIPHTHGDDYFMYDITSEDETELADTVGEETEEELDEIAMLREEMNNERDGGGRRIEEEDEDEEDEEERSESICATEPPSEMFSERFVQTSQEPKLWETCNHMGMQHLYINGQPHEEIIKHFTAQRFEWIDLIVDVKARMPWIEKGKPLRPATASNAASMSTQTIDLFNIYYHGIDDDRSTTSRLLPEINADDAMMMYEADWEEAAGRRPPHRIMSIMLHEFAVKRLAEDLVVPDRACAALKNAIPCILPSSAYGRKYWLTVISGGTQGIKGRAPEVVEEMSRRFRAFLNASLIKNAHLSCIVDFVVYLCEVDLLCAQTPVVEYEKKEADSLESHRSTKAKKDKTKKSPLDNFPLILLLVMDLGATPRRGLSESAVAVIQELMRRAHVTATKLREWSFAAIMRRALLCLLDAVRWHCAQAGSSTLTGAERRRVKAAEAAGGQQSGVPIELQQNVQSIVRLMLKDMSMSEVRDMLCIYWLEDILDSMEAS